MAFSDQDPIKQAIKDKTNRRQDDFSFETEVLPADKESIERGASLLRQGEVVAFPTETVYGLGGSGLNASACRKIFEAKSRPADNPLILHVASVEEIQPLVKEDISACRQLMEAIWPGPATLIFHRTGRVPDVVTAGGETVAVRFPSHPIAHALIQAAGLPIAAPSANRSGRPSPTNAADVYQDMRGRIPLIIDGGSSQVGIESTVIDLTTSPPLVLRPGYYTVEELREVLPEVELDHSILKEGEVPRSPGQKYRHYAPQADMWVYVGGREQVMKEIQEENARLGRQGKKVGLLLFEEDRMDFSEGDRPALVLYQGKRADLGEMAHGLFSRLREFDRQGVDVILSEGVKAEGFGRSIMNRMSKSASGQVVVLQ